MKLNSNIAIINYTEQLIKLIKINQICFNIWKICLNILFEIIFEYLENQANETDEMKSKYCYSSQVWLDNVWIFSKFNIKVRFKKCKYSKIQAAKTD